MKCKACKKTMNDILTSLDYDSGGMVKKAVNIPARRCPQCGNVIVADVTLARLKGYGMRESGKVIDFAEYERQEAEDIAVLHMLGLM